MIREDQDIVERLRRATPYGLSDFTVLADAIKEIERLRALINEEKAK